MGTVRELSVPSPGVLADLDFSWQPQRDGGIVHAAVFGKFEFVGDRESRGGMICEFPSLRIFLSVVAQWFQVFFCMGRGNLVTISRNLHMNRSLRIRDTGNRRIERNSGRSYHWERLARFRPGQAGFR